MVEVTLEQPTITVKIDGKEYTLVVRDDGIFIQSNGGLEIVQQSETGNWLLIK